MALEKIVPACGWIRSYRRADLWSDLSSALIVAVMLVPQGMAYALTLLVGVEEGIIVGSLFALLMFVRRTARPDVAELGYVEEEDAYLGVRSFPEAKTHPEVLVIRFDASFYYANVPYLEEWLIKAVADRPKLKWIVINCRGVNSVDVTAVEGLEDLISGYRSRGIEILFAGVKRPIRDRLKRAGWDEKFGGITDYPTTRDALRATGLLEGSRARVHRSSR